MRTYPYVSTTCGNRPENIRSHAVRDRIFLLLFLNNLTTIFDRHSEYSVFPACPRLRGERKCKFSARRWTPRRHRSTTLAPASACVCAWGRRGCRLWCCSTASAASWGRVKSRPKSGQARRGANCSARGWEGSRMPLSVIGNALANVLLVGQSRRSVQVVRCRLTTEAAVCAFAYLAPLNLQSWAGCRRCGRAQSRSPSVPAASTV